MTAIVNTLLAQSADSYVEKANCFNAVQLYFNDTILQKFVGSEEFVEYIGKYFSQLSSSTPYLVDDVSIVWSRSSLDLRQGKININQLLEKQAGYPFGLIIEHAYCVLEDGRVFQKPNPKLNGLYEVITEDVP